MRRNGGACRRRSAAKRCVCMAEELRASKDALGSLVSMENGKIKAEGDGEVQEMIDIADFAVGQSRMLYGLAMHSERPQHRMYEQWHPLGVVGIISAFNFPVAVWAWNAFLAAICGNISVWKPSPKTPLCAIAVQEICQPRADAAPLAADLSALHRCRQRARRALHRRSARCAGLIHRFDRSWPQGRRTRRGTSRQEPAGAGRQQRDHRRRVRRISISRCPSIVFGAVGTAGQRCTSTRRVFVHRRSSSGTREAAPARLRAGQDWRPAGTRHVVRAAHRPPGGGEIRGGSRSHSRTGRRDSLRRSRADRTRQLCRARDRARPQRLAHRADRDLRADPVPDTGRRRSRKRSRNRTAPRTACLRRSLPTGCRTRSVSCRPKAAIAVSPM